MTIWNLCLVLNHLTLIFQMITSTEKFQIILPLILANLRWRNMISASQNSPKAKHLITPGKVTGNIPALIWKYPIFKNEPLTFCNEGLNERFPSASSKSSMFATQKKGDLKLPSNYRGITLTAISAKIYNSLLLNQISENIEPILRQNQNGFRKGRSTLPRILALRRIIEEICASSRNATLVFLDFSKAFDSFNRKIMFHILPMYGIPKKIIAAIGECMRIHRPLLTHWMVQQTSFQPQQASSKVTL